MPTHHSWFSDLAFGPESAQLGAVGYGSHKRALSHARSALSDPRGVGLLLGPEGSGADSYVGLLRHDVGAIVDALA